MSTPAPHETPAAPEPVLRFRHFPLLLIALSGAVTQPYARSVGELVLTAGITVLTLVPPVAQVLRYFRGRGASRAAASPLRDWVSALVLAGLANLVFLVNLLVLRGSLLAR